MTFPLILSYFPLCKFAPCSPLPSIPLVLLASSLPPPISLSPSEQQWSIHPSERGSVVEIPCLPSQPIVSLSVCIQTYFSLLRCQRHMEECNVQSYLVSYYESGFTLDKYGEWDLHPKEAWGSCVENSTANDKIIKNNGILDFFFFFACMRGKCWLSITIEMRHHGVRSVHACFDKYEVVESGLTAIFFF